MRSRRISIACDRAVLEGEMRADSAGLKGATSRKRSSGRVRVVRTHSTAKRRDRLLPPIVLGHALVKESLDK